MTAQTFRRPAEVVRLSRRLRADDDRLIAEGYQFGDSARDIAARITAQTGIAISRAAVLGRAHRLGLKHPKRYDARGKSEASRRASSITEEGYKNGDPVRDIAARITAQTGIAISRAGVIARAKRLGLQHPKRPLPHTERPST